VTDTVGDVMGASSSQIFVFAKIHFLEQTYTITSLTSGKISLPAQKPIQYRKTMFPFIQALFTVVVVVGVTGSATSATNGDGVMTITPVMGFVPTRQRHAHQKKTKSTTPVVKVIISSSNRGDRTKRTIDSLRGGDDNTQLNANLGQYAGDVSSLFGNMITPASILGA
jgi:hypothetical protein